MSQNATYPYAEGNLLEQPNTYFYSAYRGEQFLKAWRECRGNRLVGALGQGASTLPIETEADSAIEQMTVALEESLEESVNALAKLDKLVQSFEVTKRIFDNYTRDFRAVDKSRYHNIGSYALFSRLLNLAFKKTGCLTYLNAFLKCNDILNAVSLPSNIRCHLQVLFADEISHVDALIHQLAQPAVSKSSAAKPVLEAETRENASLRTIAGVIMIACASARSQAYIQTLLANGMVPERVIFLGPDKLSGPVAASYPRRWCGLMLPNLGESFSQTCASADIELCRIKSPDVNSDQVLQVLKETDASMVIYSGVGGQIVKRHILEAGPRFLHIHAGMLPAYRGSTTIYYSLLKGEPPSVSSIFLDVNIDTGPILKRATYQRPPVWMDVDNVYDSAIRADLLSRVMSDYQALGHLSPEMEQNPEVGRTYYVIHPVLKHIALLSINSQRTQ